MLKKGLLSIILLGSMLSSLLATNISKHTFEEMKVFKELGAKIIGFVEVGNTGIYYIKGIDNNKKTFNVAVDKKGEYLFMIQGIFNIW